MITVWAVGWADGGGAVERDEREVVGEPGMGVWAVTNFRCALRVDGISNVDRMEGMGKNRHTSFPLHAAVLTQ